MAIVEGFYHGQVQLKEINKANVVTIPKKESPVSIWDLWPISVINIIPKLLSKILANRLKAKMPDLISCNQTAFIQERQIMDNFVATRELLQHIASSKNSTIFLKIDFAKAFDSINWNFFNKSHASKRLPFQMDTLDQITIAIGLLKSDDQWGSVRIFLSQTRSSTR